jgi:hypothetical protein
MKIEQRLYDRNLDIICRFCKLEDEKGHHLLFNCDYFKNFNYLDNENQFDTYKFEKKAKNIVKELFKN